MGRGQVKAASGSAVVLPFPESWAVTGDRTSAMGKNAATVPSSLASPTCLGLPTHFDEELLICRELSFPLYGL